MNFLFPFVATVIWGGNAVVSKASVGVLTPIDYGFYRWLLAVILLTPFLWRPIQANASKIRANLGRLFVLGTLGGAAFPGLMYFAARDTTATNIGIIQSIMPILSIGLAVIWQGHRPTLVAIIGTLVSLVGVAVVVSHGNPASLLTQAPNKGDLLMLVATVCYALYTALLKQWDIGIPLLQSVYLQAIAASLAFLPLFLFADHGSLSLDAVPFVAYATLLASIAAPWVWMHGVQRIGPARISLFFNLVPVFATLLAVAVLGERPDATLLFGGALVIGGVVLAETHEKRRALAARR